MMATPAQGQYRTWDVAIGAGPSLPMAALGDEVDVGYHVSASLGYRTARLPVGLRLELLYQDFDAVEREPSIFVARGGEWYRQLSGVLSATYDIPVASASLRPYGLAGIGWIREWHDDITYSGERHVTMSINVGAGLDFPILRWTGFVQARYMNLFLADPLRTGPPAVHPEVEFRSVPVTLGIRL
jgi:hypothetical protein